MKITSKALIAAMAFLSIAAQAQKPSGKKKPPSRSLCYKDYCPCAEPSPTDKMICDHLRRGGAMDPAVMQNGAVLRDANRAMDAYDSGK